MEFSGSLIFVDTSFIKALVDERDDFHGKAKELFNYLLNRSYSLIISNFILDETLTLVRHKCGYHKAIQVKELVLKDIRPTIDRVTAADENAAWEWFEKDWSKLSFTDCVSFAQMKRLGLDAVVTFDEHFRRVGFRVFEV